MCTTNQIPWHTQGVDTGSRTLLDSFTCSTEFSKIVSKYRFYLKFYSYENYVQIIYNEKNAYTFKKCSSLKIIIENLSI